MKKIKLDLDTLQVDSFKTTDAPKEKSGTVFGHATLVCTEQFTCTSCANSNESCGSASCGATCGGICGDQTYAMYTCYAPQSCNYCEM
jgi:hypothetical protein